MTTLAGYTIPRNIHAEVPVCNYSASIIPANATLAIDATNTLAVQLAANAGMVGDAVIICASGSIPLGVAVTAIPAAVNGVPGQGTMQTDGLTSVVNSAAGAIAVGGTVACDTGGQVKAGGSGAPLIGVARSAGAAQGDIIAIQIMRTATS